MAEKENTPDRIRMGEIGYLGLHIDIDRVREEARTELRWPRSVHTFKEMSNDVTISSALSMFEVLICRAKWTVKPPKEATPEEIERAKFVEECMHDMDHSWFSFIKEVCSTFTYGFSIHEKVFRRRLKSKGSRYNDGKVGFKKLPIRSQSTIKGWKWDKYGRVLTHAIQDLALVNSGDGRFSTLIAENGSTEIDLPMDKCLHFRTDVQRDNPEGKSPLTKVYVAYRYLQEIREQEAIGITRDLAGMPTLYIPPKYMSEDATEDEKAVYEYYKKVIRNIQMNEQSGLILPQIFDPESKQPLFKFELMGTTGGKSYDTNKIIQRYSNDILQALFADLLKLGQDGVGSYSLADSKSSLMLMAVESRIDEIKDVLNTDLIPQLFSVNGWSTERLPTFEVEGIGEQDVAEFAKALQQLKATGLIAPTVANINYIAEVVGLPDRIEKDMSQEDLNELLGPVESRAGDGMEKGSGNGTSDSSSSRDNSAANKDHK